MRLQSRRQPGLWKARLGSEDALSRRLSRTHGIGRTPGIGRMHGSGRTVSSLPQGLSVGPCMSSWHSSWLPPEQDQREREEGEGGTGQEKLGEEGEKKREQIEAAVSLWPRLVSRTPSFPHRPISPTDQPSVTCTKTMERCEHQEVKITEAHLGANCHADYRTFTFILLSIFPFPVRQDNVRQTLSLVFSWKDR